MDIHNYDEAKKILSFIKWTRKNVKGNLSDTTLITALTQYFHESYAFDVTFDEVSKLFNEVFLEERKTKNEF